MRTLFVSLLTAVFFIAALQAETYKFTLAQPSEVNGQRLEPGEYRLDVEGGMASFKMGKKLVEVPVHSEANTAPARTTEIRYATTGGMYRIREITPKGAPVRLTFGEQSAAK